MQFVYQHEVMLSSSGEFGPSSLIDKYVNHGLVSERESHLV